MQGTEPLNCLKEFENMKTLKGFLTVNRFDIRYRKYGENQHTLVCVNGALQSMSIWRTLVRRFFNDFTVITFDMPGIGKSQINSGGAHVTIQEQLEILNTLIEETVPSGELTIAGASWGTAIASAYAATRPESVKNLLLSSFGMKPNHLMETILKKAISLYHDGNYEKGADLIVEGFGTQIGENYKRQIVTQFKRLNEANAKTFYEHCCNILKLRNLEDQVDLNKITARTLILNGAQDTIIDLSDMWEAQRIIPNCECRLISGVGHFLHFERPEILEEYAKFLIPRNNSYA